VTAFGENPADDFQQPDVSVDATDAAAEALTAALLDVAETLTRKSAGTQSAAEAKDFSQAVLNMAQSLVILDPELAQGGTPLEHDLALEAERNVGKVATESIKADAAARAAREGAMGAAAKPSPTKQGGVRR
jgi:hypothetical protein